MKLVYGLQIASLTASSLLVTACTGFSGADLTNAVNAQSTIPSSVSAPVAVATPAPVASGPVSVVDPSQKDINLAGYSMIFDDEFNSVSIATSSPKGSNTWYYIPPYGSAGYYSASIWDAASFSSSNGILHNLLTMDSAGKWHSGNISSVDETGAGFSTKYGYFEARAKMPSSGSGSWPAFWLASVSGIPGLANVSGSEEIDIFEWYGVAKDNNQALIQEASHNWKTSGGSDETVSFLYSPGTPMPNAAYPWLDFHVYGCQVDMAHITWYIDGVQVNQIATPATYLTGNLYIMFDYAIGGGWPLTGLVANSDFQVDWVRVYSLPK